MSRLSETIKHLRRVWYHRKSCRKLDLPKPLELVVFSYNNTASFVKFFETLLDNTRWPLSVMVCDADSDDQNLQNYLGKIDNKSFGIHSVKVIRRVGKSHPGGFNAGLLQTKNQIVAIADSEVVIPNLGETCWATEMLTTMQTYPHVGWISAQLLEGHEHFQFTLRSKFDAELSKPAKTVRGTHGNILDKPCETQLGILRRDIFTDRSENGLQFNQFYRDNLNPIYAVGSLNSLKIEHQGWGYLENNNGTLVKSAFRRQDISKNKIADVPFHVITLTHNRPFWFSKCRQSIERQTAFSNVKHIITVDDPKDLDYVPNDAKIIQVKPDRSIYCFYQTYINEALAACESDGLVMIVDDDDYLTNNRFVETCLKAYHEFDGLFFRAQLKATSRVPKKLPFSFPLYGDIASCGWVLKTGIAKQEKFFAGHGQDHDYINRIFRFHLLNRKRIWWSRDILTSTQAGRSFSKTPKPSEAPLKFNDEPVELYG